MKKEVVLAPQINWYGFDTKKLNKKFEGDLVFLTSFCVKGEYSPSMVYFSTHPNRAKKHKDYMLLTSNAESYVVRGMDYEEMEKFRYQDGIRCLDCKDIIYSVNRHDYHPCKCKNVAIDGGRDYTRTVFADKARFEFVTVDLLQGVIPKKEDSCKNTTGARKTKTTGGKSTKTARPPKRKKLVKPGINTGTKSTESGK